MRIKELVRNFTLSFGEGGKMCCNTDNAVLVYEVGNLAPEQHETLEILRGLQGGNKYENQELHEVREDSKVYCFIIDRNNDSLLGMLRRFESDSLELVEFLDGFALVKSDHIELSEAEDAWEQFTARAANTHLHDIGEVVEDWEQYFEKY